MTSPTDSHIAEALRIADELNRLADCGEECAQDNGCPVLFGVIRDCAYRIKGRAEQEREVHIRRELWCGDVLEGGRL